MFLYAIIGGWRENNLHKVLSFDKASFRLKDINYKGRERLDNPQNVWT